MFLPILKIRHLPQWCTGLILCLIEITIGLAVGSTSPYMARLTAGDDKLPLSLTEAEASWVASLLSLGRVFGALFGAILQVFIGFKKTLLLSTLPLGLSWICIIAAYSTEWLYASRLFCGIGIGVFMCSLFAFLAEIADPSIRGTLIFMNLNQRSFGLFLGSVLGSYLTLAEFSYVVLSITLLFVVLFIFVPESPYHYVVAKDLPRAKKALLWYKRDADVTKELQEMEHLVGATKVNFATIWKELKKPEHQKSMFIIFALDGLLYFSGFGMMAFYLEIILTKGKIELTPSIVVMALRLCGCFSGTVATLMIDKFGKRTMMYISAVGVIVGHSTLGLHFHLLSLGVETSSISWLPIFGIFFESISVVVGLIPVPSALSGELFPPVLKMTAALNFNMSSALFEFIVSKNYQPFVDLVGDKFVFWTFAGVALLSIFFTYFFVPETTGKSLGEIQEDLKKNDEDFSAPKLRCNTHL